MNSQNPSLEIPASVLLSNAAAFTSNLLTHTVNITAFRTTCQGASINSVVAYAQGEVHTDPAGVVHNANLAKGDLDSPPVVEVCVGFQYRGTRAEMQKGETPIVVSTAKHAGGNVRIFTTEQCWVLTDEEDDLVEVEVKAEVKAETKAEVKAEVEGPPGLAAAKVVESERSMALSLLQAVTGAEDEDEDEEMDIEDDESEDGFDELYEDDDEVWFMVVEVERVGGEKRKRSEDDEGERPAKRRCL